MTRFPQKKEGKNDYFFFLLYFQSLSIDWLADWLFLIKRNQLHKYYVTKKGAPAILPLGTAGCHPPPDPPYHPFLTSLYLWAVLFRQYGLFGRGSTLIDGRESNKHQPLIVGSSATRIQNPTEAQGFDPPLYGRTSTREKKRNEHSTWPCVLFADSGSHESFTAESRPLESWSHPVIWNRAWERRCVFTMSWTTAQQRHVSLSTDIFKMTLCKTFLSYNKKKKKENWVLVNTGSKIQ